MSAPIAQAAASPAAQSADSSAPAPVPFVGEVPNSQNNLINSASLYVGDLNPEVTEGILFEIFNAVGPVASIRVCRDVTTRRSLGYAYVNFHSQADAERALDTMNYTPIKGTPCRIMWSQRDPSLRKTGAGNVFCKNLDPSIDNKALYDTFSLFGDILSCKVVTGRDGQSCGYGFVHFETTEAADEAIDKINGMLIADREVFVGRFVKRTERPGVADWTNVFVKNLPLHWDNARLQDEFGVAGPIASCVVMVNDQQKSRGFGFIDFIEHADAAKAVQEFNEKSVLTQLGEETGAEEEEESDSEDAEPVVVDKEADEYYVEKKDGAKPDEGKKRKPKKTTSLFVSRAQKKVERERELTAKFEAQKMERLNRFAGINCFVKNLAEEVDDEILRKEFALFGQISSSRVMRNDDGEVSKGFGFVCFTAPEEATRAVTEMNGKLLMGKPIYVALAQRKEARRAQLEAHHGQRMNSNNNQMRVQQPMYPNQPTMAFYNNGQPRINQGQYMNPQMYPMRPNSQPGMVPPPRGPYRQPQGQYAPQGAGMASYNPMMPNPNLGGAPGQGRAPRRNNQGQGQGGQRPQQQGQGGQRPQRPQQQGQPQIKYPAQQQAQMEPLTAALLANASEEQRKNLIGERLFPLIFVQQPQLAGKITGMLLEMDNPELLHLIESPDALQEKVQEAMVVLQSHTEEEQ
ncbi:hypothetical protein BASA81_012808 [Batrachochytrium salamandrivorans]|nr:hypothetical protein BASA81_012808 [Batrachochytrium salamandrivorans]